MARSRYSIGVRWISFPPTRTRRSRRVHLEVAGGEDGLARLADGALGVPERHAEPGEQLADAERLGDVVVGAGVERRDLVRLLAARREHDDRHGGPFAQPPDHLEAVEVGQAEVQDDDVGLSRLGFAEPLRARRRLEQSIAVARERGAQEAPDLRLVLDEDDDGLLAEGGAFRLAGGGPAGASLHPSAGGASGGASPIGSVKWKTAPPPARGSAQIFPPWVSMMAREIARPSPTPRPFAPGLR